MKKSHKSVFTWGGGAGIGVTFAVIAFVTIVSINTDSMKSLNGQPMIDVVNITPHAGGDEMGNSGVSEGWAGESEEGNIHQQDAQVENKCGSFDHWIGQKVSNSALKKTGKPFRILPPDSMMTMDHNPERINVHVDEKGVIEDVKCG